MLIDAVGAPDAEQRQDRPAADVDHVLLEQVLADLPRARVTAEERDVRRIADLAREVAVEADDVVVGIPGRRRKEADLRLLASAQTQDVLVKEGIARLHGEAASPIGHDLRWTSAPHDGE